MIQRARGRPKIGILLQAGQPGELLRLDAFRFQNLLPFELDG